MSTNLKIIVLLFFATPAFAQSWKSNFGGEHHDSYQSVTAVADGIVAAGYSYAGSFGVDDWENVAGKGGTDAIIVKYDLSGNMVWKRNFGGSDNDYFEAVTSVSDGIVAVGFSYAGSFGVGDLSDITDKNNQYRHNTDAIIVKYDLNGNLVWKRNFGGSNNDYFYSVTTVPGGIVAVGHSCASSFSNGDWSGVTDKNNLYDYNTDAIIVKYDLNGNVVWKRNFGGSGSDEYNFVTSVSDGIVAVGYSSAESFGNGDWSGITDKGNLYEYNTDAMIVKYDWDGNVVWKKNFGGSGADEFYSVTSVSDGIVASGMSGISISGGDGDWTGIAGKGVAEAIIVKYDLNGNMVWKKNFGDGYNIYQSVASAPNDLLAIDFSSIVKCDLSGNQIGKRDVNGNFNFVISVTEGIVATVGCLTSESFGEGYWTGFTGKGGYDAIIDYYLEPIVITVEALPNGFLEIAYSQTLIAKGATPITWSIEDGNLPPGLTLDEATGEISGTPTRLGTFDFTAKATNAAESKAVSLSITVFEPATIIDVTISPATATIQKGATHQFTASVTTTGNAPASVSWNVSDNTHTLTYVSVAGRLTIAVAETAATLTVTATSTFDPSKKGTATVTVETVTGSEERFAADLKIYPNPASGRLYIDFPQAIIDLVEIVDISGRTVIRLTNFSDEAIDVSEIAQGLYLMRLTHDGETVVLRFTKE